MRSPRFTFLGFFFLSLAFVSCHKDTPANPTSSTGTISNKVSMQLDGVTYTATSVTAIDTAGNFLMTGIINNDTAIYFTAKSGAPRWALIILPTTQQELLLLQVVLTPPLPEQ